MALLNAFQEIAARTEMDLAAKARSVLELVMHHRRIASGSPECTGATCEACLAPHVARVERSMMRGEPVTFVLPAFPAKSPNPVKVLGPLPDMAEERALVFLEALGAQIGELYAHGARIILCSDGRVFSDVVQIEDVDVTGYQAELARMLERLQARHIETFDLDDLYPRTSFDEKRTLLVERYADSLEDLKSAVHAGGEPQRMYLGITRFLLEDATRPGMTMSRTALQKDCKARSYEVIRRSQAWGNLLAVQFPDAVRLSIHPQSCGSAKLGLHLMEAADSWLTPWHGVAVDVGDRFVLLKRAVAEGMGAHLVFRDGRPSHYVLSDNQRLLPTSHGRFTNAV